jgi:Fic family protein
MRGKATPEALRKSVEVAVRAAAMDTGAIEGLYTVDRGFTMSVATQAIAWEHALDEKGENVRALFEAQLEAYELVIDAVTKKLPITEAWIRALHEKVCAGQRTYRVWTDQGWQEQELLKGAYKTHPNHVRLADGSIHPYSPVDRVPAEMYRLLEQIRRQEFESAHLISQASYLHYGLVVIHPFADGNGRVARALASVFFYRALSIPFLVFANQRTAYFDELHQADLGQIQPLLAFFRDRGIDTIQLVIEQVLTALSPSPDEIVSALSQARRIPIKDLENTARRLLFSAANHLQQELEGIRLPEHLEVSVFNRRRNWMAHSGYSPLDLEHLEVQLSERRQPMRPLLVRAAKVLVAIDDTNPFAFLLDHEEGDRLEIRLEDAYPEISESLQLRLSNWARRILGRLLHEWQGRNPASA